MANDPAFLMYSQDFLTGTYTMTDAQVGKYIRLLCLQHQKGALSLKDFEKIVGAPDPEIEEKFEREADASGSVYYFNPRLREEAEKRSRFCASRRENRLKKQVIDISKTSEKRKENVNENENENNKRGKRKSKSKEADLPANDYFAKKEQAVRELFGDNQAEGFLSAWRNWQAFKMEQFHFRFKTLNSELIAIKNLKNLSNGQAETAIEIINQSIANGWKGLFALRDSGKQSANVARYNARIEYANRHN